MEIGGRFPNSSVIALVLISWAGAACGQSAAIDSVRGVLQQALKGASSPSEIAVELRIPPRVPASRELNSFLSM